MPSNILHALINNKKQSAVNKKEYFPKYIKLFVKEKRISVIKIELSKNWTKEIIKNKQTNFKFGFMSILSSINPIKKINIIDNENKK